MRKETPTITGILETCLYVKDLARAKGFYQELFGFNVLVEDARFCSLDVAGSQVLLLFQQGASTKPIPLPGGVLPPHDGGGALHIGFSISRDELETWRQRLTERGIAIESIVTWPLGGTSIYFRDPDQHLVELVTPGVWSIF